MTSGTGGRSTTRGASVLLKIISIFLISTAIVMTVTFLQFLRIVDRLVVDSLRDAALGSTVAEAEQIAGPLQFRKVDDMAAKLSALATLEKNIHVGSVVRDGDGSIVAAEGTGAEDAIAATEADALAAIAQGEVVVDQTGLVITAPVIGRDGATIGALTVIRSADRAIAEARGQVIAGMSVAALIALMLAAGTVMLLRNWISRPIVALEHRTDGLASGDLDSPVPGTERRDEIGKTSRALEALRHQLSLAEANSREAIIAGAGFSASSAPLALTDVDLNIRQANASFRAVSASCLAGIDDGDEVPADALSRLPGFDARALVDGELPATRDIDLDGRTLTIGANRVEQDGRTIAYVFEMTDVTAQRNEAAIFAALDDTMLRAVFGRDGRLKTANARVTETLGSGLAGRALWDAAHPIDPSVDLAAQATSGETFAGELRIGEHVLSGAIAPVRDAAGQSTGFVLLASDITEERRRSAAAEETRRAMEATQSAIVDRLTEALGALAEGRLTTRIETAFDGAHDRLRVDFNTALQSLDQTVVQVLDRAVNIKGETDNIAQAADELSRRTEQQAATLEQFAAALTEITESVASAAKGAAQADSVVAEARRNAEASGEVVREAVGAMSEIAASSDRISKIIGVIDDIAFQTNLLALNAGVEAARAGDAGRGFAVVASEVRALAQRSSDAAREINDLISASGSQVKKGVSLVDRTGDALKGIVESVREIAGLVANIATSAQEQSKGLSEINGAIAQLDQVTQQNAAMFEETTAATRMLSGEADNLTATTGRFTTSGAAALPRPLPKQAPTAGDWHGERPRDRDRAPRARATASAQQAALADDDWEEF